MQITEEMLDEAIELYLNLHPLKKVREHLGFKSDHAFYKFRRENPAFEARLQQARRDSCEILEDRLFTVADEFDAKQSRTMLDAYSRILAFRDPARYSQRLDLNVNQNISIRENINAANTRVVKLVEEKNIRDQIHKIAQDAKKAAKQD